MLLIIGCAVDPKIGQSSQKIASSDSMTLNVLLINDKLVCLLLPFALNSRPTPTMNSGRLSSRDLLVSKEASSISSSFRKEELGHVKTDFFIGSIVHSKQGQFDFRMTWIARLLALFSWSKYIGNVSNEFQHAVQEVSLTCELEMSYTSLE